MLKEAQCIQLDDQQKLNRKNPFVLAFCEIYVPRKLPRIRYLYRLNLSYVRIYCCNFYVCVCLSVCVCARTHMRTHVCLSVCMHTNVTDYVMCRCE